MVEEGGHGVHGLNTVKYLLKYSANLTGYFTV